MEINESKYDELIKILNEYDKKQHLEEFIPQSSDSNLIEAISKYLGDKRYGKFSILGIDIYRYSHYPELKQYMIPVIFKMIYDNTVSNCLEHEAFLFNKLSEDILLKQFVPTGDGGFQILPTPLHAFVFAIYFEANLRAFNSYTNYPILREYLGELSLRYSLTYDKLFHFDQNYYGPAIITNARILSKDHLNRFLIDSNSYNWFLNKTAGIETLLKMNLQSLSQISEFKPLDAEHAKMESVVFPKNEKEKTTLRLLNVQKVGFLEAKNTTIDVHSVFVQVDLFLEGNEEHEGIKPFVLSLGNTNMSGI